MKRNKAVLREDLASLLKKYASSDVVASMARQYAKTSSQMLPIERIRDNNRLKHLSISPSELEKTMTSVSTQLDVAPLIVRPYGNDFEIVLGRRRYYASLRLGHRQLPVIVSPLNDVEMILTMIANLRDSRESNAVSIATLGKALYTEFGYSQAALATVSHMSRSTMANLLRLLKLPPSIQHLISEGRISYGHARAIINLEPDTQAKLINETLKRQWSVRSLETAAALSKAPGGEHMLDYFEKSPKSKMSIKRRSVTFSFDNKEELDAFLKRLHDQKVL
jgi:ParB family chromosome partitioning protein